MNTKINKITLEQTYQVQRTNQVTQHTQEVNRKRLEKLAQVHMEETRVERNRRLQNNKGLHVDVDC